MKFFSSVYQSFVSLFYYRELLWNFTKRDITARYSGTILGVVWSFLNPLAMFLVYLVVFGFFLHMRLPGDDSFMSFVLYFSIGFFPWAFFSSALMRSASAILDNRNYIKKVPFPAEIFPYSVILSELVSLCIGFGILIIFTFFVKGISLVIFFLPLILIIQIILTFSFGLVLSAVTVYFRDLYQILGSTLMVWFWLTPIAYPVEIIPQKIKFFMNFNPMFWMVNFYRDILFYKMSPDVWRMIVFFLLVSVIFMISIIIFKKAKKGFSEML